MLSKVGMTIDPFIFEEHHYYKLQSSNKKTVLQFLKIKMIQMRYKGEKIKRLLFSIHILQISWT